MTEEQKKVAEEAYKNYFSDNMSCKDAVSKAKENFKDYENLKNIYTTKQDKDITIHKLFKKLFEEQKEVRKAYTIASIENLTEELLDSLQMVVNIFDYLGIDIRQAVIDHNLKLKERGWKFDKKIFEIK